MWHDGYHFWGMHLFWWAFWALLVVWIVYIIYRRNNRTSRINTALDILQKRYASGEISKEEYEEKKAILKRDELGR